MSEKEHFIEQAFTILQEDGLPTEEQKEHILHGVLTTYKERSPSLAGRIKNLIITYPWRFALAVSTIQSVVCTLIFGTQYTNLFLKVFGG